MRDSHWVSPSQPLLWRPKLRAGVPPRQFLAAGSRLKGVPPVTLCFPYVSLTSSWLFPTCAVIITAFDLTDVQTLEHTRQVGESAAPGVSLRLREPPERAPQVWALELGPQWQV